MNNIQKRRIGNFVGNNSSSLNPYYDISFQEAQKLIKNGDVTLDEFVDCVCDYQFYPTCGASFRLRNIKKIVTEIEGLNEQHIFKLGVKYRNIIWEEVGRYVDVFDFLNFAPIVSNSLVSYYIDLVVTDYDFIKVFVYRTNKISDFANFRLADAIVKYFSEYKLINIDNIVELLNKYWYEKINNGAFMIIANGIIAAKVFKIVYKFAKNVENIPENVMRTIVNYVASTNSPEFIYLFLNKINLSVEDIKILTDAIMKTENIDYISYSSISLGYKETNKEEVQKLGGELLTYLVQRGFLDVPISDANNCLEKLEEKLLNSDDSIENPFAATEDAKRIRFVRTEETAEDAQ